MIQTSLGAQSTSCFVCSSSFLNRSDFLISLIRRHLLREGFHGSKNETWSCSSKRVRAGNDLMWTCSAAESQPAAHPVGKVTATQRCIKGGCIDWCRLKKPTLFILTNALQGLERREIRMLHISGGHVRKHKGWRRFIHSFLQDYFYSQYILDQMFRTPLQ